MPGKQHAPWRACHFCQLCMKGARAFNDQAIRLPLEDTRLTNLHTLKSCVDHLKAGEPLTRAQFEPQPFATFLNELQPYWGFTDEQMWPAQPTTHTLELPERQGYHVLLGVWEIAETDKAFYQVVDLDFVTS